MVQATKFHRTDDESYTQWLYSIGIDRVLIVLGVFVFHSWELDSLSSAPQDRLSASMRLSCVPYLSMHRRFQWWCRSVVLETEPTLMSPGAYRERCNAIVSQDTADPTPDGIGMLTALNNR